MSFWQKLLNTEQQENEHKNQIACVENDYSCKTNDQLLLAMLNEQDEEIRQGIKNVLISRGFSRKELNQYPPSDLHV